jgi:hypothetical protein
MVSGTTNRGCIMKYYIIAIGNEEAYRIMYITQDGNEAFDKFAEIEKDDKFQQVTPYKYLTPSGHCIFIFSMKN